MGIARSRRAAGGFALHESADNGKAMGPCKAIIVHQGVLDRGVHFIQKPYSVDDLAAKVRGVLDSD